MLLQTNSYIVPKEKRAEHARLMRRFRQALHQVGCDNFEVYEQVGANWGGTATSGRFVQIMRFRDRKHQLAVQNAERNDPAAQQLIAEFCELINYPYQQQQQQFVVGFYASALPVAPVRALTGEAPPEGQTEAEGLGEETADEPAQSAPLAQSANSLDSGENAQEAKLEETFEETAAALSAQEMPVEEVIEKEVPPSQEENFFADDAEITVEDQTPSGETQTQTDEPASEPLHQETALEQGELHPLEQVPHLDGTELESDLMLGEEDDDISRLAEELSADDEELHNPRNGDPRLPHHGRASGNGEH